MNFFEAMVAIGDGETVSILDGQKYKKIKGNIKWWDKESGEWLIADLGPYHYHSEWKIHEEPKEENGLWESTNRFLPRLTINQLTINIGIPIVSPHQSKMWVEALETFMRLKGHHLAVKATPAYQYYLTFDMNYGGIFIAEPCNIRKLKSTHLSPMFSTQEDAMRAIEDIGEPRLLKMAKVFQGVYD